MQRFRIAGLASVLALLVLALVWALLPTAYARTILMDGTLVVGALAATAAAALRAWRSTGEQQFGWGAIAGGLLLIVLGEAVWGYYDVVLREEVPYPGLADVFYLAGYVPMAVGILALGVPRLASLTSGRHLLDAFITVNSLLLAAWVFLIAPTVGQLEGRTLESAVSLTYPFADLVLAAAAFLALAHVRPGHRVPLALLAVGVMAWGVTDAWFGYQAAQDTYESGSFLDAGWLAGYLLIALAAVHPAAGRSAYREEVNTAGSLIPYITVVIAVSAFAVAFYTGDGLDHAAFVIAMVGFAALVSRQFLAVRETLQLAEMARQAGEQARSLVHHSADMVMLLARDGTVTYANPATFQGLGYAPDDLLGRTNLERLDTADLATWKATTEAVMRRPGEPAAFEVHVVVADGSRRLLAGTLVNHLDDPVLGGLLVTCQDVTEERDRQRQAAEVGVLLRLEKERSRLINGAAHSLRTPLTPLHLKLSLLRSGRLGPINAEQEEAIQFLDRNLRRLQAVADDVLEAFRLQGHMAEERMEVEVGELVDKAADEARSHYAGLEPELEISVAAGIRAMGDPALLRRAIGRLVMHGLDHCSGPLRLHVQVVGDHVEVALAGADEDLDERQARALLDPFSGQEGSRSGLALYVSRLAMEAQGGRLERRGKEWVAVLPALTGP